MVAFVDMLIFAHVTTFSRGHRLGDAFGEAAIIVAILFYPSLLGGIVYAATFHRRFGVATRRRALILSPIALWGVWLIVGLYGTLHVAVMALAATLLFGVVVPLPRRHEAASRSGGGSETKRGTVSDAPGGEGDAGSAR